MAITFGKHTVCLFLMPPGHCSAERILARSKTHAQTGKVHSHLVFPAVVTVNKGTQDDQVDSHHVGDCHAVVLTDGGLIDEFHNQTKNPVGEYSKKVGFAHMELDESETTPEGLAGWVNAFIQREYARMHEFLRNAIDYQGPATRQIN